MDIQKKLIEDILSSYYIINENKKFIWESTFVKLNSTNYSNLKYDMDGTQNDEVSKTLLDDLNTASKSAGIVSTITTARTGHAKNVKGSKNVSRHMSGTGVDIAIINGIGAGGATGPNNGNVQFRELGEKLKNTLVSMGYSLNVESGNAKAVLWQTNTGGNHFNHLHVSNNSGVSSQPSTSDVASTTTDTQTTTSSTAPTNTTPNKSSGAKEFAKSVGKTLMNVVGINESFDTNSFGNDVKSKSGKILIPKSTNTKIESPVSGRVVDILTNSSCINQIVIEFNEGFLEYCGITSPSVSSGKKVRLGELLGKTTSNVTVTMYSKKKRKENITITPKPKIKTKNDDESNLREPSGQYAKLLVKGYRNLKKSFDKDESKQKKLDENINRIKGLL